MATRNIIDLSQPITPASPAPCDPPVKFRTVASHGPDSPYQMMWFGMTDHTGTHIDAPLHFVPGGKPIELTPERRMKPGLTSFVLKLRRSANPWIARSSPARSMSFIDFPLSISHRRPCGRLREDRARASSRRC